MNQSSRMRVLERARKLGASWSASFLLWLAFTAAMVYYAIFPLNAIWQTDGIVQQDCAQWMWNLWSVNEAITSGHNPYASKVIYFPIGVANLSHQAIAVGFFPVTFLVKTLTGGAALYPLYTYRLLIWLCLTLLMYFSYWLLRELSFAWGAAVPAAIAYTFSDFFMDHIGHLNILAGFFIPLSALLIVRFYKKPASFGNATKAAVILGSAVYFTESSFYIYLATLLFVLFQLPFAAARKVLMDKLKQAGARRLFAAAAVFLLVTTPYLFLLVHDDVIKPSPSENSIYSANLASFFIPHPQRTPLYGPLFSALAARPTAGIGGYEVFTSFLLLLFGLIGVIVAKRRLVRIAAFTAIVFYVLSLGPTLKVFERDTGFTMPYAFLMRLPLFDWGRTPSRFVMIGMFFLMIVAGGGLTWLRGIVTKYWSPRGGLIISSLLLVWAISEAYPHTPRQPALIAPQNLASRVTGPVLNLPLNVNDGYAMFLQVFHRQPIATGYLARGFREREEHFIRLRRLLDKGGAGLCDGLSEMGIKTIILGPESYMIRAAAEMGPLNLGQCSFNIVDLRGTSNASSVRTDGSPARGWENPKEFPRFVSGTTLNFNLASANPFLWYGWSGIEPFSRWTSKGEAAVVFSLDGTGDQLVRIKMSPFLAAGKLERQLVKIKINGQLIASMTLNEPESKVYSVLAPSTLLRENNVLTFELPDADSPHYLGVSDDTRLLGINVQWIKLDRVGVDPPVGK